MTNPNNESGSTEYHASHFGFKTVNSDDKREMVKEVFDTVASRYDVMNDMMSAGLHHAWKDRLMDKLRPAPNMHLLDMAGGTGDVGFRFLARGGGNVTISDINEEMLAVGQERAVDKNLDTSCITWQAANAETLPFDDNSFDAYTISFGIRNVTHLDSALSEAKRVLKTGGHFLCLEFSHLNKDWMQRIYDTYSFNVIPAIGEKITGDKEAYQYLVESIRQFPNQQHFSDMMRDAGFGNVNHTNLTGGVVAIHSGWVL